MSQPPKTRSFRAASGTKSWIFGTRRSVRFPSRMVPSCVSDPIGCAIFFLTASTPAINVVLTAPRPGIRTPNFPDGVSILTPFCTTLPPLKNAYISHKKAQNTQKSSLWLIFCPRHLPTLSPTRFQKITIHPSNHYEPDFLRADGFTFANVGAAPEQFLFDLRHHT